jgi:alanine transaminase
MYGLSAEESLDRIQKAFDTRNDGNRLSPESPEQVEFVTGFIEKRRS